MKKLQHKMLSALMALVLLVTLAVPQLASAYTVLGDVNNPTLTIFKYAQEPNSGGFNGNTPPETRVGALNTNPPGDGLPGQTPTGEALEGVEFTLTQTHAFDPATNEWTEVAGATPIVRTTDASGQITLTSTDGLQLGRYTVQETNGPASVILNTEIYSVDIPMTSQDGTTLNYDVTIYPKNEVVRGDAELLKVNEAGEILPGVTFSLYQGDGTLVQSGLVTDVEGKITIENLPAGNYYFQETATIAPYALNDTPINFEVSSDGTQSVVEWTNGLINTGNTVTNYEIPEIEKDVEGTDSFLVDRDTEYTYNLTVRTPGDIQNYVKLGVRDVLDDRLEYAGSWTVTGTDASNIAFNQDGQTLTWEVINLALLSPNSDIRISFTAKIKPDAVLEPTETGIPNTATVHFDNNGGSFTEPTDPNEPTDPENPPTEEPPTTPPVVVTPTDGALQILKVDKSDNSIVLQGAEFKLTRDEAGTDIVDATDTIITVNGAAFTGLLENLVTDVNGQISIEGLTPGVYYLHETKAPTYTEDGEVKPYRLLTSPLEVTVIDGVDENEVTVENSKSGWELPTTGGIGTILFTTIGLLLMSLAAFALFRRKNEDEESTLKA